MNEWLKITGIILIAWFLCAVSYCIGYADGLRRMGSGKEPPSSAAEDKESDDSKRLEPM